MSIALRDVVVTYRKSDTSALTVPELTFSDGELVVIVGPSGCGKSTLLSCISGLVRPKSGQVTVHGKNIARMSAGGRAKIRRTTVDTIFQDLQLLESLTVVENIEFASRLANRKCSRDDILTALAAVDMPDVLARRIWELSGGQRQRIAIARSMIKSAPVILADEPTSALDERTTTLVTSCLKSLAHESGKAVIIVTHDPIVAEHADRIITLADGVIVSDQPTALVGDQR